jgi:hypothetical protein
MSSIIARLLTCQNGGLPLAHKTVVQKIEFNVRNSLGRHQLHVAAISAVFHKNVLDHFEFDGNHPSADHRRRQKKMREILLAIATLMRLFVRLGGTSSNPEPFFVIRLVFLESLVPGLGTHLGKRGPFEP